VAEKFLDKPRDIDLLSNESQDVSKWYPAEVLDWHQYDEEGPTWKVDNRGIVEKDEEGRLSIPRTVGAPITAMRIMNNFGDAITHWSNELSVPVDIIIGCIATETGGKETARREEPGYTSDAETPHRVSVGLMQTLISTAQSMCPEDTVTSEWLEVPYNSIKAGVRYIKEQFRKTNYDPPLVACAYNAGGLYRQNGEKNRWKLRQYPIGTGKHADRFCKYYNDSMSIDWNDVQNA